VQVVQILQSHENRFQTAYSAKACINPKAANCVLGFPLTILRLSLSLREHTQEKNRN